MRPNALQFYAQNETSLRKHILDLLSVKWPLPLNNVHTLICQDQNVKVSYQAIRKAAKQLFDEGCIVLVDKNKYQINLEWVKELINQARQIETNYQGKFVFQKTIFEKEGPQINTLVVREGIVRDKLREEKLNQLLKELIPIYREEFGPHNIFNKSEDEILDYLLGVQKQHEIVIFLLEDKVIGGTVFEKKDESLTENHSVWKLKHFALTKGIAPKVEKSIINEVEDRLMKKSKSLKIQLNLSEKEERYISFFGRFGFTREGTLKDHYRVGENMYIYSKVYSRSS